MIKASLGQQYEELVLLLYEQVLLFESKNSCDANLALEEAKNVLGFSTSCEDLKTDYLLSIKKGTVSKSLLL